MDDGVSQCTFKGPGNKRPGVGLPKVEAHTVRERNLKPGPGLLNAPRGSGPSFLELMLSVTHPDPLNTTQQFSGLDVGSRLSQ